MVKPDRTTIRIKRETFNMLREIGKKYETYDDIIKRLLREAGYEHLLGGNDDIQIIE